MDQAHEEIADMSAVLGFIKESVLAMEDGFLQGSLANIVVQGRPCCMQKQGELVPVILHVHDGLAEAGVRLDQVLIELLLEPIFQVVHQRCTLQAMIVEPFLRRHLLLPAVGIVFVNFAERLQHMDAFFREPRRHLNKFASAVRDAV